MAKQADVDGTRSAPTLEAVTREFDGGVRYLRFAAPIEHMFKSESVPERLRVTTITSIVAVVLYDFFIVVDWQTMRDQLRTMIVLRFFVFTPFILSAIFVLNRLKRASVIEWAGVLGALCGVACPMIAMVFSQSPDRLNYQYGSLLVLMFCTVIQRLRFRQAIVATLGILAIQVTAVIESAAFEHDLLSSIIIFFATASLLLLLASYLLEQSDRRGFLLALRGRLLHDKIVEGARRDPLTHLFNRKHLVDVANRIWNDAGRLPLRLSAIMIDIDHFKTFNDSYGHLKGDECLRAIGSTLAEALDGREALAFRFGGEEMLVLMPGADRYGAERTADMIRHEIQRLAVPHPVLGPQACVTASFGIAEGLVPDVALNDLIAAADNALYVAKRDGRNCIRIQVDEPGPAAIATAA